jgi:hypothetical protein
MGIYLKPSAPRCDVVFGVRIEDYPRTLIALQRRFGNEEPCAVLSCQVDQTAS